MKKIIILAVLVIQMIATAQTQVDLSNMTSNITLGQNCSSSQTPEEYVTIGNVNLNGYELNLRNVKLTIRGNLNGTGNVDHCGQSNLVLSGTVQNNPNLNGIPTTFTTLSLAEFKLQDIRSYEDVKVFDMQGKFLGNGSDLSTLSTGIYIFIAKGYKSKKVYIN